MSAVRLERPIAVPDVTCQWCVAPIAVVAVAAGQLGESFVWAHADSGETTCTIVRSIGPYDGWEADRLAREAMRTRDTDDDECWQLADAELGGVFL